MSLFGSFKKIFSPGKGDERSSLSRKVQEAPQDPQARQKLGLFLLRAGEVVEGTDQLARAAILYEKRGFTTKAIAVLRQMLKSDPSNIDFQRWIIRLFAQQGHTGDALSELQRVAAGGIQFSSDDQRIEFFRNVSESMPDHPLPHLLVADVYLLQRKMFEAVSEMEKAVQLDSSAGMQKEFAGRINVLSSLTGENSELCEPTGFLWIAMGKIGDALPFLERAAEHARKSEDPKRASDADQVLALLQEGRGEEIAGAMSFAEAAERLSGAKAPIPPPAVDRRAPPPGGQEEERILQSAVEKLQAKVKEEIGESDPEARYNLGIAYKEMGLLDEAAEEFRLSRSTPSLFLGASYLLAETVA
ncbi:MAG TPA: tetratricopeptide repeat protein, partial [Candidatus Deferrimicrobiaceae bacterium]|nr:tetratricopeptide repeat protein [Candidatus Deferrimicrobiaceae bacterium]